MCKKKAFYIQKRHMLKSNVCELQRQNQMRKKLLGFISVSFFCDLYFAFAIHTHYSSTCEVSVSHTDTGRGAGCREVCVWLYNTIKW